MMAVQETTIGTDMKAQIVSVTAQIPGRHCLRETVITTGLHPFKKQINDYISEQVKYLFEQGLSAEEILRCAAEGADNAREVVGG